MQPQSCHKQSLNWTPGKVMGDKGTRCYTDHITHQVVILSINIWGQQHIFFTPKGMQMGSDRWILIQMGSWHRWVLIQMGFDTNGSSHCSNLPQGRNLPPPTPRSI